MALTTSSGSGFWLKTSRSWVNRGVLTGPGRFIATSLLVVGGGTSDRGLLLVLEAAAFGSAPQPAARTDTAATSTSAQARRTAVVPMSLRPTSLTVAASTRLRPRRPC